MPSTPDRPDAHGRPLRVGLLWHAINNGNLGVGALTLANIALARAAAARAGVAVRFVIIGFVDPGRPAYVSGPDIDHVALDGRAMLPGGALARVIRTLDLVLDIGGGDSFTDIYGAKRFAYLWLSKWSAVRHRVPLIFSPQTIGPFSRWPFVPLAAHALRRATHVFTRDPQSSAAARALAADATLSEATDVAFALPFDRVDHGGPGDTVHVGVNVSGLLFNGGYGGGNQYGLDIDYADFSRRLITALAARPDVRLHLISHVVSDTRPVDDDGRVADLLHREFPGTVRVPDFASPVAAKSYIAGLDFLVAARMHACIAAYSSGVPVVPVAYSRKFTGLFDGVLGYPHAIPVKGLDTAAAIEWTLSRLARRHELAGAIAERLPDVMALLDPYVERVATLLAGAASSPG